MLTLAILQSVYYSEIAPDMWRSDPNGIPGASYSRPQKARRRKDGFADPVVVESKEPSCAAIRAGTPPF